MSCAFPDSKLAKLYLGRNLKYSVSPFANQTELSDITISDNTKNIGNEMFSGCTGLSSVNIPNSITSIGSSAFSGCTGLTAISIPSSVTSIGSLAFSGCAGLTAVSIPNSVASIGLSAFNGCTGLTEVRLEDGDESLDMSSAFSDSKLLKLYLGRNITYTTSPFANQTELSNITISDNTKDIGNGLFSGCTGLSSVIIPDSVTSIGDSAFRDCSGLTAISIPSSVISIGSSAFNGCTWLTEVRLEDGEDVLQMNCAFPDSKLAKLYLGRYLTYITSPFANQTKLTDITICGNTKAIGNKLFSGCTGLTSIILPDTLTTIGDSAFSGCSGLMYITIPSSVTYIGNNAFAGCKALSNVTFKRAELDESAKETQHFADWTSTNHGHNSSSSKKYSISCEAGDLLTFDYWTDSENNYDKLTVWVNNTFIATISGYTSRNYSATIQEGGITTITLTYSKDSSSSSGADQGGINNIFLNPNSGSFLSLGTNNSGNGLFADCPLTDAVVNRMLKYTVSPFKSNSSLLRATVDNAAITDNLFDGCGQLAEATMGENIPSIGSAAFQGCASIREINIPDSTSTIGANAFNGCAALASVSIPGKTKSIGNGAFNGCAALASVTFEQGDSVLVTGIHSANKALFDDCPLTEAVVNRSLQYAVSPFKGNSSLLKATVDNATITDNLFDGCGQLAEATFSNDIPSVGSAAFRGCASLREIHLPDSTSTIGADAFNGCAALASVSIPGKTKSIGNGAFNGCAALASVTFEQGDSALVTGVHSANKALFADCPLTEAVVNRTLQYAVSPFKDNSSLLKATVDNATITDNLFDGCGQLAEATMGENIPSVGNAAFRGCASLREFHLPDSTSTIGTDAFNGCAALASVSIPGKTQSIGDGAFNGCAELASVTFEQSDSALVTGVHSANKALFADCPLPEVIVNRPLQYTTSPFKAHPTLGKAEITTGTVPDGLFNGCTKLTAIDLANSIDTIGVSAFAGCANLRALTLPDSIRAISDHAFENCSMIEELSIPTAAETIGEGAFSGCQALASVNIAVSDKPLALGTEAFSQCPLEDLAIGRNLTYTSSPFAGKSLLSHVEFNDSVSSIGNSMFSGCAAIEEITLPHGLKSIGASAFNNCSKLKTITIPANVATIGAGAFRGCTQLDWFTLETSDKIANPSAAFSAQQLADMTVTGISPAVTIALAADDAWSPFRRVAFKQDPAIYYPVLWNQPLAVPSALYADERGCLVAAGAMVQVKANADEEPTVLFRGEDISEDVAATDGFSFIPDYWREINRFESFSDDGDLSRTIHLPTAGELFNKIGLQSIERIETLVLTGDINGTDVMTINRMSSLKNLDLSGANIVAGGTTYRDDLKTSNALVGSYFFYNVANLENLWLPNTATGIADNAFDGNKSLRNIIIGSATTTIGKYAFNNCASLTAIVIPKSTTTIADRAFNGCAALSTVKFEDAPHSISVGNAGTYRGLFDDASLEKLYIGRDISYNNYSPFLDKKELRDVTIGNSVTALDSYYFSGCAAIDSISIPNSVKKIGNYAFSGCLKLQKVVIEENGAMSIGSNGSYPLFSGTALREVYVGSVLSFSISPFKGSSTLERATIMRGTISDDEFRNCTKLHSVELGDNVTALGSYAFSGCPIEAIRIPSRITSIQEGTFSKCGALRQVSLPEKLNSIEYYAFADCILLEGIAIPQTVSHLGESAFANCRSITSVNIPDNIDAVYTKTFANCASLAALRLGKKLTKINDSAFTGCNAIAEIRSLNPTPPVITSKVFEGVDKNRCQLIVTKGNLVYYWLDPVWKEFLNISDNIFDLYPIPGAKYGDAPIDLSAYAPEGIVLTYQSSNPDVALIDGSTLTIVGAGEATVGAFNPDEGTPMEIIGQMRQFVVEKADLTVALENETYEITQGDPMPEFNISYTGLCYNDTFMDLDEQPVAVCAAADSSVPGQYDITLEGGSDRNYNLLKRGSRLVVKEVSGLENVSAGSEVKCYGRNGVLYVEGAPVGAEIAVYQFDGTLYHADKADGTVMSFAVAREGFYIVTVDGKPFKIKI